MGLNLGLTCRVVSEEQAEFSTWMDSHVVGWSWIDQDEGEDDEGFFNYLIFTRTRDDYLYAKLKWG